MSLLCVLLSLSLSLSYSPSPSPSPLPRLKAPDARYRTTLCWAISRARCVRVHFVIFHRNAVRWAWPQARGRTTAVAATAVAYIPQHGPAPKGRDRRTASKGRRLKLLAGRARWICGRAAAKGVARNSSPESEGLGGCRAASPHSLVARQRSSVLRCQYYGSAAVVALPLSSRCRFYRVANITASSTLLRLASLRCQSSCVANTEHCAEALRSHQDEVGVLARSRHPRLYCIPFKVSVSVKYCVEAPRSHQDEVGVLAREEVADAAVEGECARRAQRGEVEGLSEGRAITSTGSQSRTPDTATERKRKTTTTTR